MGLENSNGIMDNSLKETGKWELKMVMEFGSHLKVVNIKGNGA